MMMCDAVFPSTRTGISAPLFVTQKISFAFTDKPANSFLQPVKNKLNREIIILVRMYFIRIDLIVDYENA
jgi:hypothetical protein